MPTLSGRRFLLDDFHHDFRPDVGVDLDAPAEFAQRADRLRQVDLALVDVHALLLEPALDVARGDGAVQLVFVAYLDREREADAAEPARLGLGDLTLGGAALGGALRFERDPLLVPLGGGIREPLGQEEVAGVAVLHLDDLARLAQVLHVLSQDDLHRHGPFECGAGRPNRRRNCSQVSLSPKVARPGTRNSSGRRSAAASAAPITSAPGDTPVTAARATTIAAPRSRYSAPSTSSTFNATPLSTASVGVINTVTPATTAHTQWSPKRNSGNGASAGSSGRTAARRCHAHASARPVTLCSSRVAGTVALTNRTTGSNTGNACGSSSTTRRIAALACRVASQRSASHADAPSARRASATAAAPATRLARPPRADTPPRGGAGARAPTPARPRPPRP